MKKVKVFKGGSLFDGFSEKLIENAVVVMEDDKFTAVGKAGDVVVPQGENVEVQDVTGKVLLPGLIETHMHLNLDGGAENSAFASVKMNKMELLMRAVTRINAVYEMGYTTIRGGGDGWGWFEVALRDGINRGDVPGPRFQTAGHHITVYGGHGCFLPYNFGKYEPEEQAGMYADGPWGWRKAARLNIWNRVDNIKVVVSSGFMDGLASMDPTYAQASLEEVQAAVDEAHACNRLVIAHTNGPVANQICLDAGVDIMTHGGWMDERTASTMAERGIYWEPTNAVVWLMYKAATDTLPQEILDVVPNNFPKANLHRAVDNWNDKIAHYKDIVYNTGVKVLMGSDSGCPFLLHGKNSMELEANVFLGMKPVDALRGCTSLAAESLRMADKVGSVEVGKQADLVIVDGNPLEDVKILQYAENILAVYRDGKVVIDRR